MDWITLAFQIGTILFGGGGLFTGVVAMKRAGAQARIEEERRKRHEAKAAVTVATLEHEAEENEAQRVWTRLGVVEKRLADRDGEIDALKREAADCKEGREQCEETTRDLSAQLAKMAGRLIKDREAARESTPHPRFGEDEREDTGLHELAEIEARASLRAVPTRVPLTRSRRDDMEPEE